LCRCYDGWGGPTCALRTCASGPAWVGYGAGGADDVHGLPAECSGVGSCNRKTGVCACPAGFVGTACQTLGCPGQGTACSGKGRCVTMAEAAAEGNAEGLSELPHASSTYSGWDATRVMGCVCDAGWSGPDCSVKRCPVGADPLVPAVPAVQALSCHCPNGPCSSGSFMLAVGMRAVSVLGTAVARVEDESVASAQGSGSAPGESVEGRLRAFFPGLVANVAFSMGAGALVCDPGNEAWVTFSLAKGAARLLVAAPGNLADSLGGAPILQVTTRQIGTAELAPCSRRGSCLNGLCQCMSGFFPSDGNGGPGNLMDCGSRAPVGVNPATLPPLTKCPGNPPCSNAGYCDTNGGALVCRCALGATGPACESAACPLSRAWWDQPAVDGTAHALAPCANRGNCRTDGTCGCFAGFTGACPARCHRAFGGLASPLPLSPPPHTHTPPQAPRATAPRAPPQTPHPFAPVTVAA
jgi:hypothetical protein